jgi:hypothetical protein
MPITGDRRATTMRAPNVVRPTVLPNQFKALRVVQQGRQVHQHGRGHRSPRGSHLTKPLQPPSAPLIIACRLCLDHPGTRDEPLGLCIRFMTTAEAQDVACSRSFPKGPSEDGGRDELVESRASFPACSIASACRRHSSSRPVLPGSAPRRGCGPCRKDQRAPCSSCRP